ncbi:putative transcription factor bZIP family [Helianthus annuus]|nr:putative transcription factor bZIP family [Helianthus annuus]KAJ0633263.1 putative transcription factor bZIP family [Helianthus annuus]KAJ0814144.1 putative transcription factor bZIP family [Helianthus annuus]KAJ0827332.1 putative transcription factor bZIP family [Helianthus annuus]
MAHLPPKVPQNWPENHSTTQMDPSWVDEFLDFSSTKRGTHRRSMSDSAAFLDIPMMADDHSRKPSGSRNGGVAAEFDRFDEEQFMNMFIDDESGTGPTVSCSNPSSPSDHNSLNEQQQVEEEESSWKNETPLNPHAMSLDNSNDKIFDPKRIKRILANRQSAQRSRVRKLQYISELERSVNSLQAEVSILSPRVAYLDHQRLVLNVDNSVLKQRIAALSQDKIFKDAHQEALKGEIERLKQMYYQQTMQKKMENGSNPTHHHDSPISDHANAQEQLMIN